MLLPLAVFFAFGLTNLLHAQASAVNTTLLTSPVEVGLYYETLCPHCRGFVIEHLLPAYLKAPERIKLKLVPYGNAETFETPEGYNFSCQHGPRECEGNKIHSCAIDIVEDQTSLVKLVECTIRNETVPEAIGEQCAGDLGISWQPILECSRGSRGSLLLKRNGDVTEELTPPLHGVPTVTLNGSRGNKTAIRADLWGEICKLLSDPIPPNCPQPIDTSLANAEE
ncbi:gamma-interferon-inducible lysosomal thiol reductase-like isoform X1 [Schistocerca nitens]|uniref:gamma-interferon-inducible lysosomal thiol reductase-like isoform X1 n=1 Tax=Schistocerca nitens TaxID=7011 RepID=UPI0021188303|nr:gamma-interferon-inducible lysosomal thiol reductase-like isoform X1 [Schistocerca nitens]